MNDKNASIESLPLQLIVGCIIAIVTITSLAELYKNYSREIQELELKAELKKLIFEIERLYKLGNGSMLEVTLCLKDIEYLKIGDRLGGEYSKMIRYKFQDANEQIIVISDETEVTSKKNNTLVLGAGSHRLVLKNINEFSKRYIQINLFLTS